MKTIHEPTHSAAHENERHMQVLGDRMVITSTPINETGRGCSFILQRTAKQERMARYPGLSASMLTTEKPRIAEIANHELKTSVVSLHLHWRRCNRRIIFVMLSRKPLPQYSSIDNLRYY